MAMVQIAASLVVSPILKAALDKATKYVTNRISIAWGLKKELADLVNSLTLIAAVLEHAEELQCSEPAVRIWLQNLEQIAYDSLDVLDLYAYQLVKISVETPRPKMVKKLCGFFSGTRLVIAHKLKKIKNRLAKVKQDAVFFQLIADSHWSSRHPGQSLPTDSMLPANFNVVGRDDDVSKFVDLLNAQKDRHFISGISMVGMPGVGKTTLAKLVYKKAKEEKLYDLVAWVCVSDDFDEQRILGEMLEHFNGNSAAPRSNINVLLQDLARSIESKTFLLILDDVWNQDQHKWDAYYSCLLKIVKTYGNCIVITTRHEGVASVVGSTLPMQNHLVKGLSNDECWSIIKHMVLGSSTTTLISSDLEAIGQDIAKQCGGLPLVAAVIGGTLGRHVEADKWLAVKNNGAWSSEDRSKILSILKISFDHLSAPLKKCFSYCSIFPKDFKMGKDDLVQLWMAQGFLHESISVESTVTMEEIGDKFFHELVCNSFFQEVEIDVFGNVICCKMHDVVHDLALSVSKGETMIWETGCIIDKNANIRHLRVKFDGKVLPIIPRKVAKRLYSLFSNVDVYKSMKSDLKLLRCLKLFPTHFQELPHSHSLGKLKLLKYLEVPEGFIRSALPKRFPRLYNLQTLRVERFLYWHHKIREQNQLLHVPGGLSKLISLRHIYGLPKSPRRIRQLTQLQTLSAPFFVGKKKRYGIVDKKKGYDIEELGFLSQLGRELEISCLNHVQSKQEATRANLKEKANLQGLTLNWDESDELNHREGGMDYEVLDGLQPHSDLKDLAICRYLGEKFPSWIAASNNLVSLTLDDCCECTLIPSLWQLPNLKNLSISGLTKLRSIRNNQQYTAESITLYPALIYCSISHMDSLEEWVEVGEEGEGVVVFPCLEDLHISSCPELKTWPIREGFECCISLTSLSITGCPKLSIPEGLGCLTSLKDLYMGTCGLSLLHLAPDSFQDDLIRRNAYESFPGLSSIHLCTSLEYLKLTGWEQLKFLPRQLQHLIALKELHLTSFHGLETLPEWLLELSSLQCLEVDDCPNLKSLPSRGLQPLTNLTKFICNGCPMLRENCLQEWHKISHIPNILFDPYIRELEHWSRMARDSESLGLKGRGNSRWNIWKFR